MFWSVISKNFADDCMDTELSCRLSSRFALLCINFVLDMRMDTVLASFLIDVQSIERVF